MSKPTELDHPWGHGAESVRGPTGRGERFDCGHVARSSTDGPLRYVDEWVCLDCALARCPVCSTAGRNVLDPNLDPGSEQLTLTWR